MSLGPREREAVRRAAARVGLEAPLRGAWELIRPGVRRDRIDNEHVRLLLAFALKEDDNCIDIGAHAGIILREMVRAAPHGQHIAYEPLPEFAARLADEFPAVDVRNAAVSDKTGEATFFRMAGGEMQSALKLRTDTPHHFARPFTVQVEQLDERTPPGLRAGAD